MCSLPICEDLLRGVFVLFHAHLLGTLCIVYALINLYKYQRLKRIELPPSHPELSQIIIDKPIYLVRFFNWTVFGMSWFAFTFLPLTEGRALLRISVSFIILSEVLYNWDSLVGMVKGIARWTRNWLR
jgi:hypothetical protein